MDKAINLQTFSIIKKVLDDFYQGIRITGCGNKNNIDIDIFDWATIEIYPFDMDLTRVAFFKDPEIRLPIIKRLLKFLQKDILFILEETDKYFPDEEDFKKDIKRLQRGRKIMRFDFFKELEKEADVKFSTNLVEANRISFNIIGKKGYATFDFNNGLTFINTDFCQYEANRIACKFYKLYYKNFPNDNSFMKYILDYREGYG